MGELRVATESDWTWVTTVAVAISSIATAIAAFFAWRASSRAADATERLAKIEEERDARSGRLDVEVDVMPQDRQTSLDPEIHEFFLLVTVHNRSAFRIRVEGVTIVEEDGAARSFLVGEESGLPIGVEPRDAAVIDIPVFFIDDAVLASGVVEAVVRLATGERIRSGRTSLSADFLEATKPIE